MPAEGVHHHPRPDLLTFEEIVEVVSTFAAMGVDTVRITGGEPLVRAEVPKLIGRLKRLPGIERVTMTTNAFLLGRHAADLAAAGLDDINISLDSLRPERFAELSRVGNLGRVLDGIRAARDAGIGPMKFNAVLVGGVNDDEIVDLVRFAAANGGIMRFIEFMPIGDETGWSGGDCFPAARIRAAVARSFDLRDDAGTYGNGPARYWRAFGPDLPEEGCPVGIISAVTECFCATCNRVRVTPRGAMRACLADDGEIDLRVPLRTMEPGEERRRALEALIWRSLAGKKESHSFDLDGGGVTQRHMHAIGG